MSSYCEYLQLYLSYSLHLIFVSNILSKIWSVYNKTTVTLLYAHIHYKMKYYPSIYILLLTILLIVIEIVELLISKCVIYVRNVQYLINVNIWRYKIHYDIHCFVCLVYYIKLNNTLFFVYVVDFSWFTIASKQPALFWYQYVSSKSGVSRVL